MASAMESRLGTRADPVEADVLDAFASAIDQLDKRLHRLIAASP